MQTETIEVSEAQKHLSELLSKVVETGNHIILSENERPVARLVPVSARIPGLHSGAIWTRKDFDEPLSNEFWLDGQ